MSVPEVLWSMRVERVSVPGGRVGGRTGGRTDGGDGRTDRGAGGRTGGWVGNTFLVIHKGAIGEIN